MKVSQLYTMIHLPEFPSTAGGKQVIKAAAGYELTYVRGEGVNVRSDKGDRFVPLSSIAWFDLDTSNPTPAEPAPKARAAK